jgi:hypothetical protein
MSEGIAERISSLRDEILLLDARLAAVAERGSNTSSERTGGTAPGSAPPWNGAAVLCRLDLHALARELEREWRAGAGLPVRERGGSDQNTRQALHVLVRLSSTVDNRILVQGMREMTRWLRCARMVLGDAERPRRIPGGESCPGCRMRTLRLWTTAGIVRCVNPACAKEGRIEWNEREGGGVLIWNEDAADAAAR